MNVEIFTGIAPKFEKLTVVNMHCPCCGKLLRTPADLLINSVASKIEEYYRQRCNQLEQENVRLRELLETGGYIHLIKSVANKI